MLNHMEENQMDLNEFRNKMSSDATEENKRLKAELRRELEDEAT